jgi:hydrogenase maturation factor
MHDATEGGVMGGLYELARTSGRTLHVERERVHVSAESRSVCAAFGLDPLVTVSEGTLLIACRPAHSEDVLQRLAAKDIDGFRIGTVGSRGPRLSLAEKGAHQTYVPPKLDPYWAVYARGVKRGWK